MAHAPPPLDAEAAARSRRVVDRLHAASGADGFLPFDRFMEIALYSEDGGYYGRARSPLGPAGDFYTATQVDPLFAECLAARVRVVRAALGSPPRFQVVELGPGDGTLAAGVVRTLATDPAGLRYVLVERASSRARDAVERVGGVTTSIPVRTSESLAALGPFVGVVLANELLDAQPTRRLHWDGSAWHEAGIRVIDGRVEAAETELARPVPGAPLPASPPPDLVFEVSPSAEGLVREIADHLVEGEAIVIDYGLDEAELVRSRSGGTLAAVRDHRFLPGPPRRAGGGGPLHVRQLHPAAVGRARERTRRDRVSVPGRGARSVGIRPAPRRRVAFGPVLRGEGPPAAGGQEPALRVRTVPSP